MTKKSLSSLISNAVIVAVVITIFAVSFAPNVLTVSSGDGVISKGKSDRDVSLMVNVYWGTEYIPEMLDIFKAHNVTTTFFVGGSWVSENDAMLKQIFAMGHEIGNHGYYHKDHKKIDFARNKQEMEITHKLVRSILDYEMTLFAPPSGSYGENTLKAAEEMGYRTIMWTLDTIDWRDHDAELIYKRATSKIDGGSLVLMHPTEATVKALDRILTEIENKGLKVTTVSEVIRSLQIDL